MGIQEHPLLGTILMCDFTGLVAPEMIKRRPVVVLSPKIATRIGLCTIVALSTTAPNPIMPYHCKLTLKPPLPTGFAPETWVKGDMVMTAGFHRLDLLRVGKRPDGKRIYRMQPLPAEDLKKVRECILHALGLSTLTKHLQ